VTDSELSELIAKLNLRAEYHRDRRNTTLPCPWQLFKDAATALSFLAAERRANAQQE
jgi:hypothetical protein